MRWSGTYNQMLLSALSLIHALKTHFHRSLVLNGIFGTHSSIWRSPSAWRKLSWESLIIALSEFFVLLTLKARGGFTLLKSPDGIGCSTVKGAAEGFTHMKAELIEIWHTSQPADGGNVGCSQRWPTHAGVWGIQNDKQICRREQLSA